MAITGVIMADHGSMSAHHRHLQTGRGRGNLNGSGNEIVVVIVIETGLGTMTEMTEMTEVTEVTEIESTGQVEIGGIAGMTVIIGQVEMTETIVIVNETGTEMT